MEGWRISQVLHGVRVVPHGGKLVLRPGDGGAEARELGVVREKALEVGETEGPVFDLRTLIGDIIIIIF